MTTLLYFIIAIAVLVFVHEMGHYLAAKQCGIQVLRFSVGFGKELIKWTSKRSGEEWVVASIPLGGYVRMNDQSFDSKPLRSRAWVVFAGPLANLLFAALAYAVLFHIGREEPQPVLSAPRAETPAAAVGVLQGDRVLSIDGRSVRSFTDIRWRVAQALVGEGKREIQLEIDRQGQRLTVPLSFANSESAQAAAKASDPSAAVVALGLAPVSEAVRVLRLQADSVAQQAGLREGDRILKVDGVDVDQPDRVISRVQQSQGQPIELVVADASGVPERVMVSPRAGADGVYRIGAVVGADVPTVNVSDDPLTAAVRGVTRTWEMSLLTVQVLGRMLMGEVSWRQISGPVTIADAAGQSASSGMQSFLGFLALISISIAVLNLLPIPMLDGGHLLYYLWELVRGRPLPAEVQDAGRRMGLALIIMLTVLALFNDFARLAGW
jgi:regulator of sigma E protease